MIRLALLLTFLLALAACGGGRDAEPPAGSGGALAPSEEGVSLTGETLDGTSLSLEDYRGKALFVNVWASW